MKHLCRDLVTIVTASSPGTNMYALSTFLYHVIGYSIVGQTNFDITAPSVMLSHGFGASINSGNGTYAVALGGYVVSNNDVNRILALRSVQYPLYNSGLFRITSVNVAHNTVTIDYRSTAAPPPESGLSWKLFEREDVFGKHWFNGSNGITASYGSCNKPGHSATASRIALQSPDKYGWQVRLCLESPQDIAGAVPSCFSIAPGFGATNTGDFQAIYTETGITEYKHLHGAMWYDTASTAYRGMTVGLTIASASGQWHITMCADDVSGTCVMMNRNTSLSVTSGSGWAAFGWSDDETVQVSNINMKSTSSIATTVSNLFVAGHANTSAIMTWKSSYFSDNAVQVVGWGERGYPVPGVVSSYSDISNPASGPVRQLAAASSSSWTGKTEILDVEVLLGSVDATQSSTANMLSLLQPRRLGRLPMLMQGRSNYPLWTTTGDCSWLHAQDGVFLQWGGPPLVSGSLSGSNVSQVYTSIGNEEGLVIYEGMHPGGDFEYNDLVSDDIDATRYKKTYSYYRQVPVWVGVIKEGSNPVKP